MLTLDEEIELIKALVEFNKNKKSPYEATAGDRTEVSYAGRDEYKIKIGMVVNWNHTTGYIDQLKNRLNLLKIAYREEDHSAIPGPQWCDIFIKPAALFEALHTNNRGLDESVVQQPGSEPILFDNTAFNTWLKTNNNKLHQRVIQEIDNFAGNLNSIREFVQTRIKHYHQRKTDLLSTGMGYKEDLLRKVIAALNAKHSETPFTSIMAYQNMPVEVTVAVGGLFKKKGEVTLSLNEAIHDKRIPIDFVTRRTDSDKNVPFSIGSEYRLAIK